MKKFLLFAGLLWSAIASAQFTPGQLLTAAELNNQFALYAPLAGATYTGSVTIPMLTVSTTFSMPSSTVLPSGVTATTQPFTENTTLVATDNYVKRTLLASQATIPITTTGGTYNFASAGSGTQIVVLASGGVINGVLTIALPGSGYQVGDCLVMVGGNGDAILRVTSLSGSGVASASVVYGGTGYSTGAQLTGMSLPPGTRTGNLTGTLTSNMLLIIPSGTLLQGARFVGFDNNTTGAFTTTIKLSNGSGGSTGTGVVLPQGTANSTSATLYTDGVSDVWLADTPAGIGALSASAGSVPLTSLATQAANTVVGNATGSTATPTAITVTGCNGAAQALQWTNGTGFGCNSTIATSGSNANITSLSGLSTALSVAQGGTGRAALTVHGVLLGETTAAINQTAAGTTGQMLIGSTGADPAFGNTVSTLTATSTITPSSTAGIVGTTTNDNANAGSVGEYITSTVTSVSIPTTNTPTNITSISLTAGDWDVWGNVLFLPAGSTVPVNPNVGINTTSATLPAPPLYFQMNGVTITAGSIVSGIAPSQRITLSSTTTVFLVAQIGFSVSTMSADGYISARRRR